MITVVSGIPRSGTSLMMRMLEAGGMPLLVDNIRMPDEDNPRGYYEYEPVKRLEEDASWLDEAEGKAVKVISALLFHLPAERRYQLIFMTRKMEEVLASQGAMLRRKGQDAGPPDEEMHRHFERHVAKVQSWLAKQDNFGVLYCSYNEIISDPVGKSNEVARFINAGLDATRMAQVVDSTLYRQRM